MTLPEDAPLRLDKALAAAVPEAAALSRSRLMRMIADGAVSRDGVVVTDTKARATAGEVWQLMLEAPAPVDVQPEDIALSVVYEDADLIVIDLASTSAIEQATRRAETIWQSIFPTIMMGDDRAIKAVYVGGKQV